ncbi:MAG: GNAT family N-acetyltransferase, partial [Gammaproteobacteria bacterium]
RIRGSTISDQQDIQIRVVNSIDRVNARQWNALLQGSPPFLSHAFLAALEHNDCVGETFGWLTRFYLAERNGELVGAVPLYVKDNSYGELVFDWAWADAYHRHGLSYYPKMVVALPYTPATGPRLLLADASDKATADALIDATLSDARELGMSSLHWLFTTEQDNEFLKAKGLFSRKGFQFHWHNRGYGSFDDFLAELSSKKRKNIRRERRLVRDAGVQLEWRLGGEMNDALWDELYRFYRATFDRKSGVATLSLGFFKEIGRSLPEQVIVVLARRDVRYIAGAVMFRSADTLYGRHWGCTEFIDGLHFETCYYQGLDYCIREGLQRFEPGAQGEFKISRGFLPTETWSAHWLAHPEFHDAINRHVDHEREMVDDYMGDLGEHSPYRCNE